MEMGSNFEFANPGFLFLLAVIPILIWNQYRKRRQERLPNMEVSYILHLGKVNNIKIMVYNLLPFLKWGAFALFVIALSRPRYMLKEEQVITESIDIMLALDLSSSMLARDFNPDRLEVCKKLAAEFVDKRAQDRIGLVVFSGESFTQCPLTTDHQIVKRFLYDLKCGFLSEGTAIGMGLATAVNRLQESDAQSRIVILLTDGDNNTGYIQPLTAAEMAAELDIKVYTIGVGTRGMALTPQGKRSDGTYVFDYAQVMINEGLLKEISDVSGGQYFRAISEDKLESIYDEIDQLEKTKREVTSFTRYSDDFYRFLILGLILLTIHFVLNNLFFWTFP